VPNPLISIVDDDESTVLALAGLLRSFGFETRCYGSAEAFIQAGCPEAFRCVITDIQMPGLSGIELKRWLDEQAIPVPVIMITARSEPRLHAQSLASGAVCLLKKPFDSGALLACLRMVDVA
jgi:FixJ family two-component response regulator